MNTNKVNPLDPNSNIAVAASAGTGKTYLLVNRIINLLLHDVHPANILAITFTKKAANEMLQRVYSRLWELHLADDKDLINILENELSITDASNCLLKARSLYQSVLFAVPNLKITTFHAFCQELLQNFAFEANVPPGFELTETTHIYSEEAWDSLFQELTDKTKHPLRQHIDVLFDQLDGLYNTREALIKSFLQHRLDWWSYTAGHKDPVNFAIKQAKNFFNPSDSHCIEEFFKQNIERLKTFYSLINKLTTRPYNNFNIALENILASNKHKENEFSLLCQNFLTKEFQALSVKLTKALQSRVGDNATKIITLYEEITDGIFNTLDQIRCQKAFSLQQSWYYVGNALIEKFQGIKKQRQVLDFNDLEWQCYLLLNQSNNAEWVQYKLDYRIEHFLIDEFQDTNPTQWQLLLPLFKELAAHDNSQKSVFIVGDSKQSIYRFRRANAQLQTIATQWLCDNLQAQQIYLDHSWRSAPEIMHAVNQVFDGKTLLENFNTHATHKNTLAGYIELMPLFSTVKETEETIYFRNPFDEPPPSSNRQPNLNEANAIADKINELVISGVAVGKDNHPVQYDDILILIRNRTHANDFELALSEKNIPYQGVETGTLLDCSEVEDMLCLLKFLIAPVNDLALAQLIKSPLFNGSDNDLMTLARYKTSSWWSTLALLAEKQAEQQIDSPVLIEAYTKLSGWIEYQHIRPVHDLLNIIYYEGDVISRFEASAQPRNRSRVKANLEFLLEMALSVDSGRYPSIQRFLTHIEKLQSAANSEKPNSLQGQEASQQVRLMTIHGAKGLEAPIVFIVDTNSNNANHYTYEALVNWPADANQVQDFFLVGKKADMPNCLASLINSDKARQTLEDNNLLYVAMTRAVNMLFISGTSNSKDKATWYKLLQQSLILTESDYQPKEKPKKLPQANTPDEILIDQQALRLNNQIATKPFIQPSRIDTPIDYKIKQSASLEEKETARQRGLLIHHILYCLNENKPIEWPIQLLPFTANNALIKEYISECKSLIASKTLDFIFDTKQFDQARNEITVFYETEKNFIDGIIDRLVITKEFIYIIDYKTQKTEDLQELNLIAQQYKAQMAYYQQAIKKLYSDKTCKAFILFTFSKKLIGID